MKNNDKKTENNQTNDNQTEDMSRCIGIRHHYSGVWLGRLLGQGIMPHIIRIRGRRVWSWSGGRLEFSELCKKGVQKGDRLGELTVQEIPIGVGDGLVELTFQVDEDVIQGVEKGV